MKPDSMEKMVIAMVMFVYMILVVPVALWPKSNYLIGITWTILYSLLALGLTLEIVELLLAFIWPRRNIPVDHIVIDRQKTAVLMTICDDVNPTP